MNTKTCEETRADLKIHFLYSFGYQYTMYPACGEHRGENLTLDPEEVTCLRCQATDIYRMVMEKEFSMFGSEPE